MTYESEPHYPVASGTHIDIGHDQLAAEIARHDSAIVAIDGPAALDCRALRSRGCVFAVQPTRGGSRPASRYVSLDPTGGSIEGRKPPRSGRDQPTR